VTRFYLYFESSGHVEQKRVNYFGEKKKLNKQKSTSVKLPKMSLITFKICTNK